MPAETTKLLHGAGALSILAGIMHGLVTEAHFAEWWAYGVFFTVSSLAQGLFGFVILSSTVVNGAPLTLRWPRSSRRALYVGGIAGNLALVALYVASRTVGVLGEKEAWDGVGIAVKLVELALVAVLLALLRGASGQPSAEPSPPPGT